LELLTAVSQQGNLLIATDEFGERAGAR